jgi:hypothetical protein
VGAGGGVVITTGVMRLDDKLAALDNHAARRMRVSEWQHLRTLAAAEGDARIVEECDYRIAKLTARPDGDFGRAHARLAAKLADAKRLGLEACALPPYSREAHERATALRAALEAL